MYGIQFGGRLVQQIELCSDSKYAHGMGNCLFSSSTRHTLVAIVVGLCDMLRASSELFWLHEPSHEEVPFNEFADVGAK